MRDQNANPRRIGDGIRLSSILPPVLADIRERMHRGEHVDTVELRRALKAFQPRELPELAPNGLPKVTLEELAEHQDFDAAQEAAALRHGFTPTEIDARLMDPDQTEAEELGDIAREDF